MSNCKHFGIAFFCLFHFLLSESRSQAQSISFDEHFTGNALHIELFQGGNAKTSSIAVHAIRSEPNWPGNRLNLIYPFPYGKYRVLITETGNDQPIYVCGFDTLFAEYATTGPALQGIDRVFPVHLRIPEPKQHANMRIEHRDANNQWMTVFERAIRTDDYSIIRETAKNTDVVNVLRQSGPAATCLDITFVSEGYREENKETFFEDATAMMEYLVSQEPFNEYGDKINASCVFHPSVEDGTDEPRQHRFRNTVLDSSFNSLDIDRYLLVENGHALHRMASLAPSDCAVVLVNSQRYGGGSICLDSCITTTHNAVSKQVFVHEFGHALAYLADEYIGSVSYNDMYPLGVEPVEPNLTREIDRSKIKWRHLLTSDVELPTKSISSRPKDSKDRIVGAFEGGGYVRNGIYRPEQWCRMGDDGFRAGFCVVCQEAIRKVMDYHTRSQ